MKIQLPVRVGLMDDDFFALKWNSDLLTRDLRTTVCFEVETPAALLKIIKKPGEPNIILLDVEYFPLEPGLDDLILAIRQVCHHSVIICLSQYGRIEQLSAAIASGASGFLLKNEVRMGIVSALMLASKDDFLVTQGVMRLLLEMQKNPLTKVTSMNSWVPHPGLTLQLRQVFTLRVLYGMSAPMAAQEIHLSPGTVEKYMQFVYQRLSWEWGDDRYLAGLSLENLPPEVRAFHRFSLLPR